MDCGIPVSSPPATAGNGCPVNNQIPDWNDLVYNGNWEEASRNLHSTNNFPEFTGRICPAPCEEACTLNLEDVPVTIKTVEQAIAGRSWKLGWIKPEAATVKTGKKVAVVGSGPAGMAAAQQPSPAPATRWHVYEREPRPAACCATASPTSRWRSTTSTAASRRWKAKASSSTTVLMSA